jgi:hypothetical protein
VRTISQSTTVCPLEGKVVETLEKDGLHYAKVALSSCCIQVPLSRSVHAYLGDKVTFEADIVVMKVEPHAHPMAQPGLTKQRQKECSKLTSET